MKRLRVMMANIIWMCICALENFSYQIACCRVKSTQRKILMQTLKENKQSVFGQHFGFSRIKTIQDFQQAIPVQTYDEYQLWIERLCSGQVNALTVEIPIILEPTSGSSGKSKLIPYTRHLRKQFLRGLRPWIFNLLTAGKRVWRGKAYWSITPFVKRENQNEGLFSIGFKDDSEYFGVIERKLIETVLAVPKEIGEITELDNFRYATLFFLVREKNLSFISVWSPTFITVMLSFLPKWKESIVSDIGRGRISFPAEINALLANRIVSKIKADPARAREVEIAFLSENEADQFKRLWPNLSLVSCWADGNSARYLEDVKKLFPAAKIEHKGLLATEGVISIPIAGGIASSLAVNSHFFEFIDIENSIIKLAHELILGRTYSVVLTTGGGLYRYRLGDLVRVVDFFRRCPVIRFEGREGCISDIAGEKLNEKFLSDILESQFKKYKIGTRFFLVAPDDVDSIVAYTLFLELAEKVPEEVLKNAADSIENELAQNFHYRYCRDLGQLAPLRIFVIQDRGAEAYQDGCLLFGQRLGDIKMVVLHKKFGWKRKFNGSFIS